MQLIFGLGPIGGNIGLNLASHQQDVLGLDLDPERARQWQADAGASSFDDPSQVPWQDVTTVVIAVRTADQVASVLTTLREHAGEQHLTVLIVTTLTPHDARRLLGEGTSAWRMFEGPVSGGPDGARDGSQAMLLFGPQPTAKEQTFFGIIAGSVVTLHAAGHPSIVKLLNNTLGTYNLLALSAFVHIGESQGVPPRELMDILAVSSGNSWMRAHFEGVAADLLVKDSHLLESVIGELPTLTVDESTEARIHDARALLAADRR